MPNRVGRWVSQHRDRIIGSVLAIVAAVSIVTAVWLQFNNAADARRDQNARTESQRTCKRSYQLGPAFADFYRRNGLDPKAVKLYVKSIPTGRTIAEACP